MRPLHVYRPPRPNRFLSTAVIFGGGALLTFMVFYFIPLMQQLDQKMAKEEPDLVPNIAPEQKEEYVPPEPEKEPDEPEPEPELAESDAEIPIEGPELPDLTGGSGRVIINITPGVRLGGGSQMETGGIDSDPVVSFKVAPTVPPNVGRILSKRGAVRVVVSAMVDEQGEVVETSVADSSGIAALDQAAENALKRYKFKPAIRNGRKARARVKLPFDFRLP